jgi:hypothetical protein
VNFDTYGNLYPYQIIQTDLLTFEQIFVTDFSHSIRRKELFANYLEYIHEFQNQVSRTFYQWIDGSFVTRKLNPMDIDLVTFINHELYQAKEKQISLFRGQKVKKQQDIDAYFVKLFPTGHPSYTLTEMDKADWKDIFGYSRRDKSYRRHQKGIIQLNF